MVIIDTCHTGIMCDSMATRIDGQGERWQLIQDTHVSWHAEGNQSEEIEDIRCSRT